MPFDYIEYLNWLERVKQFSPLAFKVCNSGHYDPPYDIEPIGICEVFEYLISKLFDYGNVES